MAQPRAEMAHSHDTTISDVLKMFSNCMLEMQDAQEKRYKLMMTEVFQGVKEDLKAELKKEMHSLILSTLSQHESSKGTASHQVPFGRKSRGAIMDHNAGDEEHALDGLPLNPGSRLMLQSQAARKVGGGASSSVNLPQLATIMNTSVEKNVHTESPFRSTSDLTACTADSSPVRRRGIVLQTMEEEGVSHQQDSEQSKQAGGLEKQFSAVKSFSVSKAHAVQRINSQEMKEVEVDDDECQDEHVSEFPQHGPSNPAKKPHELLKQGSNGIKSSLKKSPDDGIKSATNKGSGESGLSISSGSSTSVRQRKIVTTLAVPPSDAGYMLKTHDSAASYMSQSSDSRKSYQAVPRSGWFSSNKVAPAAAMCDELGTQDSEVSQFKGMVEKVRLALIPDSERKGGRDHSELRDGALIMATQNASGKGGPMSVTIHRGDRDQLISEKRLILLRNNWTHRIQMTAKNESIWDAWDPSNTYRFTADFLLLFLMIYVLVCTPYYIAFNIDTAELFTTAIAGIDLFVSCIFMIDVLLNFHCTYIDNQGHFERNHRLIAVRYIKCWFWVDTASSLPWDFILKNAAASSIRVLRLLRLFRLLQLFKVLRTLRRKNVKNLVNADAAGLDGPMHATSSHVVEDAAWEVREDMGLRSRVQLNAGEDIVDAVDVEGAGFERSVKSSTDSSSCAVDNEEKNRVHAYKCAEDAEVDVTVQYVDPFSLHALGGKVLVNSSRLGDNTIALTPSSQPLVVSPDSDCHLLRDAEAAFKAAKEEVVASARTQLDSAAAPSPSPDEEGVAVLAQHSIVATDVMPSAAAQVQLVDLAPGGTAPALLVTSPFESGMLTAPVAETVVNPLRITPGLQDPATLESSRCGETASEQDKIV
ncbi:hypothetical protein CEUSTIGMA_g2039.t1 [Chlamydomonas eustigma]|uniref:Ion transport domain-containing protein n=1 Tax=Chlamydomonas eustigma TaxID=1157962 RepID=A0A250WUV2_9CHLO|nr:hypothetical protein CEUSTIGMA_g2039.t1 [Chlamydomonas eustigma]|eukprot:GAX74591.1 hypothetical protein CEUSTIGMA_g2039.t1 [Chlamydomonas eustigma]